METCERDALVGTLENRRLQELVRKDAVRPLSWDELTRQPLPDGWSVQDAWEALFSLRRLQGIYIPPTYSGATHRTFYVTTGEFLRAIIDVARKSSQDSPLFQRMCKKESFQYVQRALYREACAAAGLDGIEMPYETVAQLVPGFRPPRSPEERVVANIGRAIVETDALIDEPFSEHMLRGIYAGLTHGVREDDLEGLLGEEPPLFIGSLSSPELYAYANDESKDSCEPSLVTGLFLRETIQVVRPFPHLNNIMAWLIYRLYSLKHNYPVVANIPTVSTTLLWASGEISADVLRFGVSGADASPANERILVMGKDVPQGAVNRFTNIQEMRCSLFPDEGDITRYLVVNLGLLLYALENFERELEEGMGELAELSLLDTTLNYRQNEVVLRARHDPSQGFTIARHQAANGVAYATARADLMGLADRGYLRQELRGKKYVFVAGPRVTG
ncbi:MAG: hypothetical protein IJI88_01700 [Atopobiaceae bacterium]|nr:hypothetical protein [Atopobiaceae bacterium]